MRVCLRSLVVVLTGSACGATALSAKNITAGDDRFEVNWSSMTIKFYGEAPVPAEGSDAFKKAENNARFDAVKYAEQAAEKALANQKTGKIAAEAKSYNTTYYADGRVRVYLEKSLAEALRRNDINFKTKQVPSTADARNSGIVFEVKGATSPVAHYQVVSETGQVLFSAADIAQDAYNKNLMGQWHKGLSAAKSGSLAGSNAARLQATMQPNGDLQVSEQAWREATTGNESVLTAGKISLVIP